VDVEILKMKEKLRAWKSFMERAVQKGPSAGRIAVNPVAFMNLINRGLSSHQQENIGLSTTISNMADRFPSLEDFDAGGKTLEPVQTLTIRY
jgi:hypothetical protein